MNEGEKMADATLIHQTQPFVGRFRKCGCELDPFRAKSF